MVITALLLERGLHVAGMHVRGLDMEARLKTRLSLVAELSGGAAARHVHAVTVDSHRQADWCCP